MAYEPQSNVQGDLPPNLASVLIAGENGYFGSQAIKYGARTNINPANSAVLMIGIVAIIGLVLYMNR